MSLFVTNINKNLITNKNTNLSSILLLLYIYIISVDVDNIKLPKYCYVLKIFLLFNIETKNLIFGTVKISNQKIEMNLKPTIINIVTFGL